jgi:hypothetical protein
MINTSFWSDPFVQELEADEKLLYLYFLSNERTSICGIYEVTERTISFDTRIEISRIRQIVDRLSKGGKITKYKNWYFLVNFAKHQKTNPSIEQGIARAIKELPEGVFDRLGAVCTQPGLLELEPKPELKTPLPPGGGVGGDLEKFINAYPKKVSGKNLSRLKTAFGKVDENIDVLLDAIDTQKRSDQWTRDSGRYIPNPVNWIENEAWKVAGGRNERFGEGEELKNKFGDPVVEINGSFCKQYDVCLDSEGNYYYIDAADNDEKIYLKTYQPNE